MGGQITVAALEPNVTLVSAVPAPGFSAELKNRGPDEVRIEFESATHRSSFRVRWDDGVLDVDIEEDSEDD